MHLSFITLSSKCMFRFVFVINDVRLKVPWRQNHARLSLLRYTRQWWHTRDAEKNVLKAKIKWVGGRILKSVTGHCVYPILSSESHRFYDKHCSHQRGLLYCLPRGNSLNFSACFYTVGWIFPLPWFQLFYCWFGLFDCLTPYELSSDNQKGQLKVFRSGGGGRLMLSCSHSCLLHAV